MGVVDLNALLNGPLEKRVETILSTITGLGWNPEPITLVARFSKESYHPFFIQWGLNPETMRWRSGSARVALVRPGFSGRLTLKDAVLYAEHPEVIQEKEPKQSAWKGQV